MQYLVERQVEELQCWLGEADQARGGEGCGMDAAVASSGNLSADSRKRIGRWCLVHWHAAERQIVKGQVLQAGRCLMLTCFVSHDAAGGRWMSQQLSVEVWGVQVAVPANLE